MAFKEIWTRTFNTKKGMNDWKVWTKVTDAMSDYICKNRKSTYVPVKLKDDYQVTVTIKKREQ